MPLLYHKQTSVFSAIFSWKGGTWALTKAYEHFQGGARPSRLFGGSVLRVGGLTVQVGDSIPVSYRGDGRKESPSFTEGRTSSEWTSIGGVGPARERVPPRNNLKDKENRMDDGPSPGTDGKKEAG